MKHLKQIIYAVFGILLCFDSLQARKFYSQSPEEKAEELQLKYLYKIPVLSVNSLLQKISRQCDRFPTDKEFKDFVLNGQSKDIKCTEIIKMWGYPGYLIGKEIPFIQRFLERNEYSVISDGTQIVFTVSPSEKSWKFKYFKPEKYKETLVCKKKREGCRHFIEWLLLYEALATEGSRFSDLYSHPMYVLLDILNEAVKNCNRLPTDLEFKEFVLNGKTQGVKCSKLVKFTQIFNPPVPILGKDIPSLIHFLNRNEFQVYSDTSKIYVIVQLDPKKWNSPIVQRENYESVLGCSMDEKFCKSDKLAPWIHNCQKKHSLALERCFLGDKKVIDYGTVDGSSEYIKRKRILDAISKTRNSRYNPNYMHIDEQWNTEFYKFPAQAIEIFLRYAIEFCERFPREQEFNEFVLNGKHKNIKCAYTFYNTSYGERLKDKLGLDNPALKEFLDLKQYQFFSDTKNIFFISEPHFKNKDYIWIKEDFDIVINCSRKSESCTNSRLEKRVQVCKDGQKELCYFGNKKVIDYD